MTNQFYNQMNVDVIGDVHGCYEEMMEIISVMGYTPEGDHPEGRIMAFVGDYVDKGPMSAQVTDFVMTMSRAGKAIVVRGNHDDKIGRVCKGNPVPMNEVIAQTMESFEMHGKHTKEEYAEFFLSLPFEVTVAQGALKIVHAAPPEEGTSKSKAKSVSLYGHIISMEKDEDGYPIRHNWVPEYNETATEETPFVVFGHVMHKEVYMTAKAACVDTGCVVGNKLSAVRFPEMEVVSVPSRQPVTRKCTGF